MGTTVPTFSTVPDSVTQNESEYNVAWNALLSELNPFVIAVNAVSAEITVSESNANASAISAANSAAAALASENAAAAGANATAWQSGVDGAVGEIKYSLIDFLPYRRKNSGAFTTDPSLDSTNWVLQLYTLGNDAAPVLGGNLNAQSNKITNLGQAQTSGDAVDLALAQTIAHYF